ncbi:hypothetical protein GQ53DRAFT_229808 [Thozetella sp. PMI_491]|nr:hypothetical protein GQ53DRAFT_229808 [Thozetella sp. PMI_491]
MSNQTQGHGNYQYDYSTLEVVSHQESAGLEVLPDSSLEHYYPGNPSDKQPPGTWSGGTLGPQLAEGKAAYDANGLAPDQTYGYGQEAPPPNPKDARIWGLKRKTFFIVLAVVLVIIIGAVVGGAVGGTVGKRNQNDSAAAPSTPGGSTQVNSTVLSSSQLSAINWTDSTGSVSYYGVFWQDQQTSLVMSLWDSSNKTWETVNITARTSISNLNIKPMAGTSLSATVRSWPWTAAPYNQDFGIALFFISTDNVVQELYSTDTRGGSWSYGDLTTSDSKHKAGSTASLGAWWSLCVKNCTNYIYLFYEDDSQALRFANQSNWSATPLQLIPGITAGTGIGVSAMSPDSSGVPSSPKIYYDGSGVLSEVFYSPPWYYGQTLAKALPSIPPRLAAQGFINPKKDKTGFANLLLAQSYPNGTLLANFWNNSDWHGNAEPTLQGKVFSNWTNVALTGDMKFFGLTNTSEIHQFSVDRSSPLSWTYVGQVAAP